MTGPFGCLFAFVFAILAILLFAVLSIVRKAKDVMSAFSGKKRKGPSGPTEYARAEEADGNRPHRHGPHQKIFDDDEGEYVDFVEIKNR